MIHSLQNDDKFFSKFKIYNIFLISLVFIYFYNPEIFMNNNFDFKYKKIKEFEDSSFKSFIKNFFTNQISDMKKFREINCKNILLNNISFHKNEYPDVSIIITVYNQANCFHSALRSVQNQSLKNIEILK